MTTRTCKFGCGCLLSGWDDNARKYIEAGTGGLHTRERCEELKAQLAQKNHNDHGNEEVQNTSTTKSWQHMNVLGDTEAAQNNPKGWIPTKEQAEKIAEETKNYVDHTQGQKLKLKVLTDPTPDGLALLYNNFGETHNIRFSQYHPVNALYTIAVFFEEIKQ